MASKGSITPTESPGLPEPTKKPTNPNMVIGLVIIIIGILSMLVAVAAIVLMFILPMISQMSIPQLPPAEDVVWQNLMQVRSGGLAKVSSQTVVFPKDHEYYVDYFEVYGGFEEGSIEFCCEGVNDPEDRCAMSYFDEVTNVECKPDYIAFEEDVRGKVMTYCPINEDYPCLIGIREVE